MKNRKYLLIFTIILILSTENIIADKDEYNELIIDTGYTFLVDGNEREGYRPISGGSNINIGFSYSIWPVKFFFSTGVQWNRYNMEFDFNEDGTNRISHSTKYPFLIGISFIFPKPESMKPYISIGAGTLMKSSTGNYIHLPKIQFLINTRTGLLINIGKNWALDLSYSKYLGYDTKLFSSPGKQLEIDINTASFGIRYQF